MYAYRVYFNDVLAIKIITKPVSNQLFNFEGAVKNSSTHFTFFGRSPG